QIVLSEPSLDQPEHMLRCFVTWRDPLDELRYLQDVTPCLGRQVGRRLWWLIGDLSRWLRCVRRWRRRQDHALDLRYLQKRRCRRLFRLFAVRPRQELRSRKLQRVDDQAMPSNTYMVAYHLVALDKEIILGVESHFHHLL